MAAQANLADNGRLVGAKLNLLHNKAIVCRRAVRFSLGPVQRLSPCDKVLQLENFYKKLIPSS
jgi:hypothetical protein